MIGIGSFFHLIRPTAAEKVLQSCKRKVTNPPVPAQLTVRPVSAQHFWAVSTAYQDRKLDFRDREDFSIAFVRLVKPAACRKKRTSHGFRRLGNGIPSPLAQVAMLHLRPLTFRAGDIFQPVGDYDHSFENRADLLHRLHHLGESVCRKCRPKTYCRLLETQPGTKPNAWLHRKSCTRSNALQKLRALWRSLRKPSIPRKKTA